MANYKMFKDLKMSLTKIYKSTLAGIVGQLLSVINTHAMDFMADAASVGSHVRSSAKIYHQSSSIPESIFDFDVFAQGQLTTEPISYFENCLYCYRYTLFPLKTNDNPLSSMVLLLSNGKNSDQLKIFWPINIDLSHLGDSNRVTFLKALIAGAIVTANQKFPIHSSVLVSGHWGYLDVCEKYLMTEFHEIKTETILTTAPQILLDKKSAILHLPEWGFINDGHVNLVNMGKGPSRFRFYPGDMSYDCY